MKELVEYLLTEYNGTGKTFVLQVLFCAVLALSSVDIKQCWTRQCWHYTLLGLSRVDTEQFLH